MSSSTCLFNRVKLSATALAYGACASYRAVASRWMFSPELASGKVNEARQAIQQAADKGYVRAVFALGSIISSGIGTAPGRSRR